MDFANAPAVSRNRADRTIVHLKFETGGRGQRYAGEPHWRKPQLKGKDKPAKLVRLDQETPYVCTHCGAELVIQ